jgi:hypothetical protein
MLRRENGVSNAQPFLGGPLRISAFSAFNGNFNAEDAEVRRGPQRKTHHVWTFCAKPIELLKPG